MERVNLFMQKGMFMTANGWMIMHLAMEYTSIRMGHSIKDSGKMIYSMVMAMRNGLMVVVILGVILKVKRKELVFISGVMDQTTKESGSKTK